MPTQDLVVNVVFDKDSFDKVKAEIAKNIKLAYREAWIDAHGNDDNFWSNWTTSKAYKACQKLLE